MTSAEHGLHPIHRRICVATDVRFPKPYDLPSSPPEARGIRVVALNVGFELGTPIPAVVPLSQAFKAVT
jgi:hypothetical protein